MIEALFVTFARSVTWTVGRYAGRRIVRQLGWMLWFVVVVAALWIISQHTDWSRLWINSLRSWLLLSAGLLPMK